MPLTIGETIAGVSLGAAFIAVSNWIRSVANRCTGAEDRIKTLEGTVTEKSGKIDVHESTLCAGEKQMEGMEAELTALNKSLVDLHQQGHETATRMEKAVLGLEPQIKALGVKIKTDVKEIFLKLDPRLEQAENHIDCHKKKIKELQDKTL